MKKSVLIFLVVVFLGGAFFIGKSHSKESDFEDVEVFSTFGGVAFFEKNTGKVYIYDSRLDKLLAIKKVTKFGEPIVDIEKR
jgi:hypothetical protein